jgi:lantibiotic leader peptide-processing serine protease
VHEANLLTYSWDIREITNNYKSHEIEQGHSYITVGVIDSGIDVSHNGLKRNINKIYSLVDDYPECDFTGHGTMVAGQIAGYGIVKGIVPKIKLNSYKIFDENNKSKLSHLIKALKLCLKDNVNVINMSLGFTIKLDNGNLSEIKELESLFREVQSRNIMSTSSIGYATSKELRHYPSSFDSVISCQCLSKDMKIVNSNVEGQFCVPSGDYKSENFLDELVTIYCPMSLSDKMLGSLDFPRGYTFMGGESLAASKLTGIIAAIQSAYFRKFGEHMNYHMLINILKKHSVLIGKSLKPDLFSILNDINNS